MNRSRIVLSVCIVITVSLVAVLAVSAAQSSQAAVTSIVLGWTQVNTDGFGDPLTIGVSSLEVFDGQLYAGTGNWQKGGQVWRTNNGTDWAAVSEPGFAGVYTYTNPAILDMVEFKSMLYASTGWDASTGQIWRSPDGTSWQQVVGNGFGNPANGSITAFTVFSDTLYAATGNIITGVEIWRSSTGNISGWTPVVTNGLGYHTNQNVTGFTYYDGYLYISIEGSLACQVWRSADGVIWLPVTTDGFGDADNISMSGWAILDNFLYIGTRNETTGAQLWRFSESTGWERVVDDGFGDLNNVKIESLFTHQGYLFAATQNNVSGIEVMRSSDGISWSHASPDGFGDSHNYATLWSNATTSFDGHLYIGTWNRDTGGEIWEYLENMRYLPLVTR